MGIEIANVGDTERGRAFATLVMAFAADPFVRWIYPKASQYHIMKDTGMAEADVVIGLLNAWWWDCETRGLLLMVDLVSESPDRFCFVRALDDWLPNEDDD
jgi:hypothetical protein